MDLQEHTHRRYNPLTREWVLVSPHRNQRPWQGQTEPAALQNEADYDPACYLCPENVRAGGHRNPAYVAPFVYDNDFPALLPDSPAGHVDTNGLLVAESERGICRVVCFSPHHNLTLANMATEQIHLVVDTWADQFGQLIAYRDISHVLIFENRGEMMGCSNPHPHAQIWANQTIPNVPRLEQESLAEYRHRNGSCLLCDYVELERAASERIVCENEHFLALVPFWAIWPFEVMLCSKSNVADLGGLDDCARTSLADILKRITTRYDNLFESPFP